MSEELTACQVAFQEGLKTMLEVCEDPDQAMLEAGKLLGVNPEPDEGCDAALAEGLDEETCQDFRGLRQWILCRVFNAPPDDDDAESLLETHDGDFQLAVSDAWDKAKMGCRDAPIDV